MVELSGHPEGGNTRTPLKRVYLDMNPFDLNVAPGKGPIPAKYAFVGMAPSPNRPKSRWNEPFGAASYQMLQSVLEEIPGGIYVTNLVKTPTKAGTRLKKAEKTRGREVLLTELQMVAPQRILALGKDAAEALCPGFTSLREDHGSMFYNDELGCHVVPTYHFSAVGYDPSLKPILKRDIIRFISLVSPSKPPYSVFKNQFAPPPTTEKVEKTYLDIETTGLNPDVDTIISVGWMESNSNIVKIINNPTVHELTALYKRFKASGTTVVLHNATFDMTFLSRKTNTFWDLPIEDTMIMAHVAGENILSLKHLTTTYTSRPGSRSFGGPADAAYLAEDVLSTSEVYQVMKQHLDEVPNSSFIMDLLNELLPNLIGMRIRGVYLDQKELVKVGMYYEGLRNERKYKLDQALIKKLVEERHWPEDKAEDAVQIINWNSPKQVVDLFTALGIPLSERTSSGSYSVAEAVLLSLAEKYPIAQNLLDHREATKMLTFMKDYQERTNASHPYLHPRIKLYGARTGRTSCEDPNVQQIPRVGPIKTLFRARWPDGLIGLVDLSQAELRIAGLLSGDKNFVKMIMDEDPHRAIASIIFKKKPEDVTSGERKKSKGVTFGLLYGGSAAGLADRVGVSEQEVTKILKEFFEAFPVLNKWIKRVKADSIKAGYVETVTGRRRDLTPIILSEGVRSAERKAINTPVQGAASDVALMILNYIGSTLRKSGLKSRPGFGVHDSVFVEIYPGETDRVARVVQEGFESVGESPLARLPLWKELPLIGEFIVGPTWAAVESTNEAYSPLDKFECSTHGVEWTKVVEEKPA